MVVVGEAGAVVVVEADVVVVAGLSYVIVSLPSVVCNKIIVNF